MADVAKKVNHNVFEHNAQAIRKKHDPESRAVRELPHEERMDCIAMSMSKDGKSGKIAGNVKERVDFTRKHKTYGKFGLHEEHGDVIKNTIRNDV